jgi:hypothetical protein
MGWSLKIGAFWDLKWQRANTAAAKLLYIKLSMYLFFIWRRVSKDGVGPENLDFFGPNWQLASLVAISGPKNVLIFMTLEMDLPTLPEKRCYVGYHSDTYLLETLSCSGSQVRVPWGGNGAIPLLTVTS